MPEIRQKAAVKQYRFIIIIFGQSRKNIEKNSFVFRKIGNCQKGENRLFWDMEKWALVTGSAVRAGRECALHLAECGYDLILHYFRSQEAVRDLETTVRSLGRQTRTVACDFAETGAADRLWRAAAVPGLRVIVNNAAVFVPDLPSDPETEARIRQIRINYEVPYEMMRRTEKYLSGCTVINFLDGRLESFAGPFYSYGLSKQMAAWATAGFAAVSEKNRYYAIAPKALLPPVIDGRQPDPGRVYRTTGTAVLKPVLDIILSGTEPGGTVFTV